jgi:hypothetical protein
MSIAEKGVLLFNKALIHQRLHQNAKAREILEQLFKVYESLSKQLGIQVCLLLTEVYLNTYELNKASENIEVLERRLFGGLLGNGLRTDKEDSRSNTNIIDNDKYKPHIFQVRWSFVFFFIIELASFV